MGLARLRRPGDDRCDPFGRQPAGVSCVGFRHVRWLARVGSLACGREHGVGERFIRTGHRRQVLVDRPRDALDRLCCSQICALARDGSLVDGDGAALGDDV